MPARLVKPIDEPPDFPEVIYTFYRQRGEVTWSKQLELLKLFQGNPENVGYKER